MNMMSLYLKTGYYVKNISSRTAINMFFAAFFKIRCDHERQ